VSKFGPSRLPRYIYYLTQLERKSSRIKVKNILDDYLLFSRSKLIAVRLCIRLE
jgi:hypothetical protein